MVPVFIRFFLRMKTCLNSPPVAQQNEKIARADGAIAVEIGRTSLAHSARTPVGEQDEQVAGTDASVTVQITRGGKRRHEDASRKVGKDHPKGQLSGIIEVYSAAVLAARDERLAAVHEHTFHRPHITRGHFDLVTFADHQSQQAVAIFSPDAEVIGAVHSLSAQPGRDRYLAVGVHHRPRKEGGEGHALCGAGGR